MQIDKILVPVDFSPSSDAALDWALRVADACGAEVEVLHVWSPPRNGIFADSMQGRAFTQRLSAAESDHPARVCGRLEFGDEPSLVILDILEHEDFDMVVLGRFGQGGRPAGPVTARVAQTARCAVVTLGAMEPVAA